MTNQVFAELASILAVADDGTHTEIDKNGTKIWRNANGNIHRDGDLPAVIYSDCSMYYYRDGENHRDGDLPAVIRDDGSVFYYKDGKRHRDGDLPAVIWFDGTVEYYNNGWRYTKP